MMGGGGVESAYRRRLPFGLDEPTSVANSGITGPIDIPDPRPQIRVKGLRERFDRLRASLGGSIRGLPRVLALAWSTSRALTITLATVTVLSALTPTATAYVAKLLMDAVVKAITIHSQHLPDHVNFTLPMVGTLAQLSSTGAVVAVAGIQLLLLVMTAALTALSNVSQQLLQEKMMFVLQHRVMEHSSRLHLAFFEGSVSYDLLWQVKEEAMSRPLSMMTSAFGLIKTTITFASMISLLVAISPLLALVALVSPIPAFISQSKYSARGFALSFLGSPIRRRMDYLSTLVTTDNYAKEIKLFRLGSYLVERFRLLGQVYYERQRRLIGTRNLVGTAWSTLTTLAGSVIYLYIALQAVNGHLTLGDLVLYTAASTAVQVSVSGLFTGFNGMYENNLYLDSLFRFLETEPEILPPADPRPLPDPVRGQITFEHVSFRYPGAEHQALDDVSFEMRAGETIAVVGRNGAGKSTLMKLLCRLYDPTEGRILLDGIDIREFDPDELRTEISAMFQDYVTYQATVAENIGLGDLARLSDSTAVREAAVNAGADSFIERLPKAYESPLGRWFDKGVSLSGGEWQKIALARAFIADAPILILDEPTSALDAKAEHDLFTRLRELARGRTTLYISHRFSTVRQADRILMLEHGRLTEHGTHTELMALDRQYAEMFNLQAAAYLDGPVGNEQADPRTGGNGAVRPGRPTPSAVAER